TATPLPPQQGTVPMSRLGVSLHGLGKALCQKGLRARAGAVPFGGGRIMLAPPGAADDASPLTPADRGLVLRLQRLALGYFLDSQRPCGLVLDRQANHGPARAHGLCSTAATGMGLIALALASAPPYRLLTPRAAAARVRAGLEAALERLPHDHGILPHF